LKNSETLIEQSRAKPGLGAAGRTSRAHRVPCISHLFFGSSTAGTLRPIDDDLHVAPMISGFIGFYSRHGRSPRLPGRLRPWSSNFPAHADNLRIVGSNSPDIAIGQRVVEALKRGQRHRSSPRNVACLSAGAHSCQCSLVNVDVFTTRVQPAHGFIARSSGSAIVLPRTSLPGRIDAYHRCARPSAASQYHH
jgi:hypothetical protein